MAKAKSIPRREIRRCIYCRDSEGPLYEEHIVAANLGGDYTLTNASCKKCQGIINKEIENPFMQGMYRDIRYKKGIGSRRKKDRPKTLSILTNRSVADEPPQDIRSVNWQKKEFSYEDHPTFLLLPIMKFPGMLRGLDPDVRDDNHPGSFWMYTEHPTKEILDREGGVYAEQQYNHSVFMRLLAKTAHCAVVAQHGLEGFEPYLVDLILGKNLARTGYYIGAAPAGQFESIETQTTKDYQLADFLCEYDGNRGLLGCFIKLFAKLRSSSGSVPPTYGIIVGTQITYPQIHPTTA